MIQLLAKYLFILCIFIISILSFVSSSELEYIVIKVVISSIILFITGKIGLAIIYQKAGVDTKNSILKKEENNAKMKELK
ncbi:MAG: hypothetical protein HY934_01700 [Candidatus Firestonebacteria bacterium]|nr:hypothetical protein [Candidatus Firestonebacteria bacterium]